MSATDPVRQIKTEQFDHPVHSDLSATLSSLAALEPSGETAYVTAALDWRPEGSDPDVRQAVVQARTAIHHAIADQEKRSAALASLEDDLASVTSHLPETLDSSAKGVFIVANSGQGVLEIEPLGLPIATSVTLAPIPALKSLVQQAEDFPLHAILQVDQQESLLSFVSEELVPEVVTIRSSDWPRHQASGGLNQRRYQARANERVEAFAKVIASETQTALDETGVRRLILSASDVMRSSLLKEFTSSVSDKLIGEIRIDIDAPFDEVLELARPVKLAFERQRESDQVAELNNAMGSGNAVAGTDDVLRALRNGQVSRVLMTREFQDRGWVDYTMQVFGIGDVPAEHPAGGDPKNMLEVPLEEEIIRQAILGELQIEIVKGTVPVGDDEPIPDAGTAPPRSEAGQILDGLGGVGAMLRYQF